MKKALLLLVLTTVVAVVFVLMRPAPKPVGLAKTRITFLSFTNLVVGAPATNAWFGVKDLPQGNTAWVMAEISHRKDGRWQRWEPLPAPAFKFQSPAPSGFNVGVIVPVEKTNGPLRVVFELEHELRNSRGPLVGKVEQFFTDLRLRWRRWVHPDNPKLWRIRGQIFHLTSEFNFGAGTNVAAGKETGR